MQPPGPPHPFRGARYDKDMFTFLPAHSKRDIVSETSRKRKATLNDCQITTSAPHMRHSFSAISESKLDVGDLQVKEFQSSARTVQSRESSTFEGYADQSPYMDQSDLGEKRHCLERGGYESRTEHAGFTSFSGQLQSPNQKVSLSSFPISEECSPRTLHFSPVTEDINQHVNHEPNSHITTLKVPYCPPSVAEGSHHCENRESNVHVMTHERLDWHPLVFQDSFQHKTRESDAPIVAQERPIFPPMMTQGFFPHGNYETNAHVGAHETLIGPPPLTQNLNHHENQRSDALVARTGSTENAPHSQGLRQKIVQQRVMTSDSPEQASKYLGESQRLPQNGLKPGAVIEGLAEKDLHEEVTQKVGSSSNTNNKQSDTDNFPGFDSNKSSANNVSSSTCKLENETNNLLNVLRLLSAASGIALADNNDGNIHGSGHNVRMLKSSLGSSTHNLNHSPVQSNLSKNSENSSVPDKPAVKVEKCSVKLGDECKSEFGTSALAEKLWDGTLQLSTSVSVSVIAFFKSGDKVQDFNWSEYVEVKGKVRLEAFEKYVQGLPRSRSRGLMVMSLCWKEGSSDAGRTGMKEVAKKYKDGKKVGFAKLSSDVDLYICPHSDAVITILAKHGFFKGMTVIKDICDPLIGCVVWKKNSSSTPATKTAKTPAVVVENSIRDKSPEFSDSSLVNQDKQLIVGPDNNATPACGTSSHPSNPNLPPMSSIPSKQSENLSDNGDDDLPEYDFNQASVSKISAEKNSESLSGSVPVSNSQLLEMVPENVKHYAEASKPPSLPVQQWQLTEHLQGSEQQNLSLQSEVKIQSLPIQEQKPIEKPRNFFDDDDMPEWCPPDYLKKTKKEDTGRPQLSLSLSNSNVPGSGSADLGSGYLPPPPPLPPPSPPLPPPPPLTQIQLQELNYSSAPRIPPPPVSSNPAPNSSMHHSPAAPTQLHFKERNYSSAPRIPPPPVGNVAPNNFMLHNPAAESSQMQLKERDYSSSPRVSPPPPPTVGNPGANKFMHNNSPAAMSSLMQFKDRDYSCGHHVPPPPVSNPASKNNFIQQSPTVRSIQMPFGDKNYPRVPRPLTPLANKLVSNGPHQSSASPRGFAPNPSSRPIIYQPGMKNSASPRGFAPNPAFKPISDQPSMKDSTCPSTRSTRP